jgi:hypothetical protein
MRKIERQREDIQTVAGLLMKLFPVVVIGLSKYLHLKAPTSI